MPNKSNLALLKVVWQQKFGQWAWQFSIFWHFLPGLAVNFQASDTYEMKRTRQWMFFSTM